MMYSHLIHEAVVADRERELERALHAVRVRRARAESLPPKGLAQRRSRIFGIALAVTRR
jgi:hypothetical protein